MAKNRLAKIALEQALAGCPFRSVFGLGITRETLREPALTVVVLQGGQAPLSGAVLVEILDTVSRGEVVLVAAVRRGLRDRAKAQIAAMAGPAGGRA